MESKRRKVVHSEGRQIITKVYHFLKTEYEFTLSYQEPNCDLSHLRNITQRTAEATGVSERTVQRVLKEDYDGPGTSSSKVQPPMKTRGKRDKKVLVDGFTANVVRGAIQEFHIVHKQIPTLEKLRSVLQEKIEFDGCLETLRSLLKKLGYQPRKTDNNTKVLVERHDIQMWRLTYIKKITEYRSQGRPIVYTGDSYVLTTHDRNNTKNAQKNKQSQSSKKLSLGTLFTIAHSGTKDGFIDNACLVFEANSATENSELNFEKYIELLLPNLPDRSVIVFNPHHNTRAEVLPTSTSNISEMQQWLTAKDIQFDSNLRRVELYDIIKKHKSNRTFKIDEYIKSKGFEVLRLPPYHPELNAIENIWRVLKESVTLKNVKQNMTVTEKLIHDSIENITSETWRNTCNSVIQKEAEYMKYFDTELEFIVSLEDTRDEETVSEESSCDSN